MSLLRRRTPSLFNLDRFFEDFFFEPMKIETEFEMPKMNIKELDKDYEISIEVPGFDKKDINIEIHNDIMTIKSEKNYEKEEKDEQGNYIYKEMSYKNFSRQIKLPNNAKSDDIDANLDKGILKIKIAKAEPEPTKKIEIKDTSTTKTLEEKTEKKK